MIPVPLAPEPERFDAEVRQPGLLALRELAGDPTVPTRRGRARKEQPTLWTKALPDMRVAYKRTCAYLALHIHRGTGRDTVDHFIARAVDPSLTYEWTNFRYASLDVNRLKDTHAFVDPCTLQAGSIGLELATFRVFARTQPPANDRARWEKTLEVLNEPTFCEARRWYHERYFGRKLDEHDPETPMSLATLEHEAPFVAAELRRQGRLRAADRG